MRKATTKSERKWGKKDPSDTKKKDNNKKDYKQEDMYKVLIDGSGFTIAMTHQDCLKLIKRYKDKAKFLNQPMPSLVLIKQ